MRQTKNLIDINIDTLYNILKQNHNDVNKAVGIKKKEVVAISDMLALVAEKTKMSKSIEKVIGDSDSEESDDEDIKDLKKITAHSTSTSANKKQEYVKQDDKKEDVKKRDISKVKCYNYKKKAWMEMSSDSEEELNVNMVLMAKMEKILSDVEESSSSKKDTLAEVGTSTVFGSQDQDTLFYYQREMNVAMRKYQEDLSAQKELATMFLGFTTELGSTSRTASASGNVDPSSSGNLNDGDGEHDGGDMNGMDLYAF
ncbi:hypothetical protein Tco_1577148 [Tanacetum coccineum]